MRDERTDRSDDPGVPEALPRTLVRVRQELGVDAMDRVWVFPPIRRGRKESGLVVASLHLDDDAGRRRLVTVSYTAERRGLDLTVESNFTEEGAAPPDMLPRVMEGVVRRAGEDHTDAREVPIEREAEQYDALLAEFDPRLFAPVARTEEGAGPETATTSSQATAPKEEGQETVGDATAEAPEPEGQETVGDATAEAPEAEGQQTLGDATAEAPEPEPMEAEIP